MPKTHFGSPLTRSSTHKADAIVLSTQVNTSLCVVDSTNSPSRNSTCFPHPSLASQDAQNELSLSLVTDSILDIRALLGNVSLSNEINSVFLNPIWVKFIMLVVRATMISSFRSIVGS